MNSPQEIPSETSVHLYGDPPKIDTLHWPTTAENLVKSKNLNGEISALGESAIASALQNASPQRKKKYSESKRKSGKDPINMEIPKEAQKHSKYGIKRIVEKLSNKTKITLKILTDKVKRKRFITNFNNLRAYHFELIKDPCNDAIEAIKKQKKEADFLFRLLSYLNIIESIPFLIKFGRILRIHFRKANRFLKCNMIHINPSSPWKILWDFLLMMMIFFQLFCYSIEKCFYVSLDTRTASLLLMIALYIDIVITYNTKIFREGNPITDRIQIVKAMLSKNFFNKLLPCLSVSFTVFSGDSSYGFLNLVLLINIVNAAKVSRKVKELLITSRKADAIYQLIYLIIKIFCCAHIIAVLWHYIGFNYAQTNPESNNWLKVKGISNEDWKTKYLFSVYWGLTTMLTVGYGDITPTNSGEMLYNIFSMFIGCCVFGYSMNKIGEILNQFQRKQIFLNEQLSKVSFMLREKKLPLETQTKIKRYLKFIWKQEQKEDPEHENFVMNKLSSELRDEVFLHTNVKFLNRVPAFKKFNEKTLIEMARHMKKVCFSPEDFVFKEGDCDTINMYFVLDGNLKLVYAKNEKGMSVWKKFKRYDYFGEREIFTGSARSLSVLSTDFSTLFQLSRSDIIKTLKKFPTEYEKFCLAKDLDVLYGKYHQYDDPCFSCGYSDHALDNCAFLGYKPNKKVILHKYASEQKLFAQNFKRKKMARVNALKEKPKNASAQIEFLSLYQDDEELKEYLDIYAMDDEYRNVCFNRDDDQICERGDSSEGRLNTSELMASPKNKQLNLTRWRKKSLRTFSFTKPTMEKLDENIIKRPCCFDESPMLINEKSHSESINENEEELSKPKSENNPLKFNFLQTDLKKLHTQFSPTMLASPMEPKLLCSPTNLPLIAIKEQIGESKQNKYSKTQGTSKYSLATREPLNERKAKIHLHDQLKTDIVRILLVYFPHNNITEIIERTKKKGGSQPFNRSIQI